MVEDEIVKKRDGRNDGVYVVDIREPENVKGQRAKVQEPVKLKRAIPMPLYMSGAFVISLEGERANIYD